MQRKRSAVCAQPEKMKNYVTKRNAKGKPHRPDIHAYSRFTRGRLIPFFVSLWEATGCLRLVNGSIGFLLQLFPWHKHVLVPFKISALHLASYWLEFEKGGRRKQLVNITNLFLLQLQVARQRSSLFLQSDVRRQLLLQTPVLKSHFARDVLQEVHDRRSPCVITMPEINKHIRHAQFSKIVSLWITTFF